MAIGTSVHTDSKMYALYKVKHKQARIVAVTPDQQVALKWEAQGQNYTMGTVPVLAASTNFNTAYEG